MCLLALHMLDTHLNHENLWDPISGCDRTPYQNILIAAKSKHCNVRGASGNQLSLAYMTKKSESIRLKYQEKDETLPPMTNPMR